MRLQDCADIHLHLYILFASMDKGNDVWKYTVCDIFYVFYIAHYPWVWISFI